MSNKNPKFRFYNNGEKTIKVYDNNVPEGFVAGRLKQSVPWNKGLTKQDERILKGSQKRAITIKSSGKTYMAWNKGLTKDTDPRIKGNTGSSNGMYGKHRKAWNKGLTKDTDIRVKKISDKAKNRKVWNKGIHTGSFWTEETLKKREQTWREHGIFGKNKWTQSEIDVYNCLLKYFSETDIINHYRDDTYPFNCDFYIKPLKIYLEVQGFWTHGNEPFDSNNKLHIEKLNNWKEKAKTSQMYKNAINVWTKSDVRKKKYAISHNLNLETIYYCHGDNQDIDSMIYDMVKKYI